MKSNKIFILLTLVLGVVFATTLDTHAVLVQNTDIVEVVQEYYSVGSTSEYTMYEYYYNYTTAIDTKTKTNNLMQMANLVDSYDSTRVILVSFDVNVEGHYIYKNDLYIGSTPNFATAIIYFNNTLATTVIDFYTNEGVLSFRFTKGIDFGLGDTLVVRNERLTFDYETYNAGWFAGYDTGYTLGDINGYNRARGQYGYYDNTIDYWFTATERETIGYNNGYDDARDYFGIKVGGIWTTASDYGNTRYNDGLDAGQNQTQQEAYDRGYYDGSNDAFFTGLTTNLPFIVIFVVFASVVILIIRKTKGLE